jgi:hypothetical protein
MDMGSLVLFAQFANAYNGESQRWTKIIPDEHVSEEFDLRRLFKVVLGCSAGGLLLSFIVTQYTTLKRLIFC